MNRTTFPWILCSTLLVFACDSASPGPDGGMGGQGGGSGGSSSGSGGGGPTAQNDVCGFDAEVSLGEADGEGFRDVPPNHPGIWYAGRVDCGDPAAPALGFPGSTIRVRFDGTALDLRLRDHGKGTAKNTNYYDVSVDGAEPTVLEVSPNTEIYALARDLPAGEHEVILGKRIEASPGGTPNAGKGEILGFRLQGETVLEASGPERRLEFVGDSITCGYGNEISTDDPDSFHYTTVNSNGRASYGALTATLLNAEYSAVAYSGKGMSRNYAGGAGETVPDFYLDTIPDDAASTPWDPNQYIPDAVVINVGTNDFSTEGVDPELYVEKYTAFLETLRAYYPNAVFVCAIGPMLSDYYPVGANAWTNAQAGVQAAVDARNGAGDANVFFLAFAPQSAPYGEDWHPSAATHESMANQTATLLREKLGWD